MGDGVVNNHVLIFGEVMTREGDRFEEEKRDFFAMQGALRVFDEAHFTIAVVGHDDPHDKKIDSFAKVDDLADVQLLMAALSAMSDDDDRFIIWDNSKETYSLFNRDPSLVQRIPYGICIYVGEYGSGDEGRESPFPVSGRSSIFPVQSDPQMRHQFQSADAAMRYLALNYYGRHGYHNPSFYGENRDEYSGESHADHLIAMAFKDVKECAAGYAALLTALSHDDPETRLAALIAYNRLALTFYRHGILRDGRDIEPLLEDPDPLVRELAYDHLQSLWWWMPEEESERYFKPLQLKIKNTLANDDPRTRLLALGAYVRSPVDPEELYTTLLRLMDNPAPAVRARAGHAIYFRNTHNTVPEIRKLSWSNPELLRDLCRKVVLLLTDADAEVVQTALFLSFPTLKELVPEFLEKAIAALVPQALKVLRGRFVSNDPFERSVAMLSYQALFPYLAKESKGREANQAAALLNRVVASHEALLTCEYRDDPRLRSWNLDPQPVALSTYGNLAPFLTEEAAREGAKTMLTLAGRNGIPRYADAVAAYGQFSARLPPGEIVQSAATLRGWMDNNKLYFQPVTISLTSRTVQVEECSESDLFDKDAIFKAYHFLGKVVPDDEAHQGVAVVLERPYSAGSILALGSLAGRINSDEAKAAHGKIMRAITDWDYGGYEKIEAGILAYRQFVKYNLLSTEQFREDALAVRGLFVHRDHEIAVLAMQTYRDLSDKTTLSGEEIRQACDSLGAFFDAAHDVRRGTAIVVSFDLMQKERASPDQGLVVAQKLRQQFNHWDHRVQMDAVTYYSFSGDYLTPAEAAQGLDDLQPLMVSSDPSLQRFSVQAKNTLERYFPELSPQ